MSTACQQCGAELALDAAACGACGAAAPLALRPEATSGPVARIALGADLSILGGAKILGGPLPQATMRLDAVVQPTDAAPLPGSVERAGASPAPLAPALSPSARLRALPLAATLVAGGGAVAGFAAADLRAQAPNTEAGPQPAHTGIEWTPLAAVTAPVGLTEDGKELVLALCYRVSSDWASECTRDHLRTLGEYPHREIAFPALAAMTYEASNADYDACVDDGACTQRDLARCQMHTAARGWEARRSVPTSMRVPDHPAVCVDLAQARAFCAWAGGRLPTGDEWERIARSGDDRLQPWGRFVMPGLLNWGERALSDFPIPGRLDGYELTAPVDAYRSGATDDGVHNLLGNVAEWVEPASDDPSGHSGVRGGSYVDDIAAMRATHRRVLPVGAVRSSVGVRCVRDP